MSDSPVPTYTTAGTRRRDGDGADRRDGLAIEHRLPGAARVGGLPHAAADRAVEEGVGLAGHSAHGIDAAAAERPDQAPPQRGMRDSEAPIAGPTLTAG